MSPNLTNYLSKSKDFQAFVENQLLLATNIKQQINLLDIKDKSAFYERNRELLLKSPSIKELNEHFGFNGKIDFTKNLSAQKELFKRIEKDIDNLNITEVEKHVAFGEASKIIIHDLMNGESSLEREPCVTIYNICTQQAEEGLAVSSATCSAGGVNFGWGICQGFAFLVYIADNVGCSHDYDECAAGNENG